MDKVTLFFEFYDAGNERLFDMNRAVAFFATTAISPVVSV